MATLRARVSRVLLEKRYIDDRIAFRLVPCDGSITFDANTAPVTDSEGCAGGGNALCRTTCTSDM
jgi:hypothetical protein